MLKTAICDLFGIKHPIVQGGMAHVSVAELVSTVSNADGWALSAQVITNRIFLPGEINHD